MSLRFIFFISFVGDKLKTRLLTDGTMIDTFIDYEVASCNLKTFLGILLKIFAVFFAEKE